MTKQQLIDLADAVLDGVCAIGGFEEIEQIANDGWPEDAELTIDSPELREMIQQRAESIVNGEDGDDVEEEEDEE
jgi:hypothetical protein